MSFEIPIGDGKRWLYFCGDLGIPINSVDGLTAQEIGERVQSLVKVFKELQPYHHGGMTWKSLEDAQAFLAQEACTKARIKARASTDATIRNGIQKNYDTLFISIGRRDGFHCQYCSSTYDLTIDHRIPVSKGGDNLLENLQLLCRPCNIKKSNHMEAL